MNDNDTDIESTIQSANEQVRQPQFQLGGVSNSAADEDSAEAVGTQSPANPRQTLVIGLQDEDEAASDPSKPGKTTLVTGQEYRQEKRGKPVVYSAASQQEAKQYKLSSTLVTAIVLGAMLLLGGIGYIVYINFIAV